MLALNITALYISWDHLVEQYQNGEVTFYRLDITDLDNSNFVLELSVNGSSTSTTIVGLKPFHTYNVIIAAYTIGVGPYSDTVNTTLPQSGI